MWSGHSLTDNPLPDDVQALALHFNLGAQYEQQVAIGAPIRVRTVGHGNDPRQPTTFPWTGYSDGKNRVGTNLNLVTELRNPASVTGDYTTLVIAENHNALDMLRWENTVPLLRHFYELFHEGSPAGRGYFYATWKDVLNKANPTPWIAHEREQMQLWESISSRINESLAAEGRADRLTTLPASGALAELVERATTGTVAGITQSTTTATLNTIFSDDVHLTRTGVYFVACVVFSSVYGRSAVGAPAPTGLSATAAASLQNLAWTYVSTYYANAPLGPQHDNTSRLSLVHAFIDTYFTYRNMPANISGYRSHFSTTQLSNPLWRGAGVDESSYWLPRLP